VKIFTLTLLLCCLTILVIGGEGSNWETRDYSALFIRPEIYIGKALPSGSTFPDTRLHTVYALSFGKFVFNPNSNWAKFYNYPQVGLTFSKSSFGHDQILGSAYTIMPFLDLNLSKKLRNSFHLQLGLGASYFTKYFDKVDNPDNIAIGSAFTWTFQSSFHYTFIITRHFTMNMGVGYIHHSNGHTQLPNQGLNSFLASISTNIFLSPLQNLHTEDFKKPNIPRTKQAFVEVRSGLGVHELGGPNGPLERLKKTVANISVGGGVVYNNVFKIKGGLIYRFYHHYYSYINEHELENYADAPMMNASSLTIYGGLEFLLGHAGIDAEIGINIFKPFYKEHSQRFEDDEGFGYTLKRVFASRLGLRFYAISTAKNPRNNVFLGAHINANLGQADFSEISLGYVHRFNLTKRKN
jgi:hypothetical protein